MRRIVCREFGPVDRLALVEEPDPVPGPAEVVVGVEVAAVSFVDGLIVQGRYQVRPPLPHTPGSAVAGRVRAVGADVDAVSVGDPVVVLSMGGGGTRPTCWHRRRRCHRCRTASPRPWPPPRSRATAC